MKAAKAWCLATVMLVGGISLASCGKDEGTNDGNGTVLGGSGGSAGTGGGAGNQGRSGSGGGTGVPTATKLGQACVNDTQCADPNAPGLICVTATSTELGGGAPPKGLCTAPCTFSTSDLAGECVAFGAGAVCYPFGDTNAGYCVEGCTFGEPEQGAPKKCHGRGEFACYPGIALSTGDTCQTDNDCDSGEICDGGECTLIETACLPACRSDRDCADGLYCDQSFLHGACIPDKPTGKALGEPCTVAKAGSLSEPDECVGFCQADEAGSTKGHCANTCGLGQKCGWNATTEKFDGDCLFVSSLTQSPLDGNGDYGFCALTCNCSGECFDPTLSCTLLPKEFDETYRGAGACISTDFVKDPDNGLSEYNQCTGAGGNGGAAGAGGSGGADAGAGGVSSGGAPVVEGGAGAGN